MKIIKVERKIGMCLNCDFKETYCEAGNWWVKCRREDRNIIDPTNIPDWCQLEDYKEEAKT